MYYVLLSTILVIVLPTIYLIYQTYKPKKDHVNKLTGRIINEWEYKTWGNMISWVNWEHYDLRMTGHLKERPIVGDEIRCKMESGKLGRFVVKKASYTEVHDQFFINVDFIGYV